MVSLSSCGVMVARGKLFRSGERFAGSSVLMSLRRGSGRPRILHMMGQREEGVGVWTANMGVK